MNIAHYAGAVKLRLKWGSPQLSLAIMPLIKIYNDGKR
jgi:hypothetical protein